MSKGYWADQMTEWTRRVPRTVRHDTWWAFSLFAVTKHDTKENNFCAYEYGFDYLPNCHAEYPDSVF